MKEEFKTIKAGNVPGVIVDIPHFLWSEWATTMLLYDDGELGGNSRISTTMQAIFITAVSPKFESVNFDISVLQTNHGIV